MIILVKFIAVNCYREADRSQMTGLLLRLHKLLDNVYVHKACRRYIRLDG